MVPLVKIEIGARYGKWTVLGRGTPPSTAVSSTYAYWLCRCDCGTEKSVVSNNLRSGGSKSCGCLRKETKVNIVDLVGQKFNRLTVIKDTGKRSWGAVIWLCLCDCGNYTEVIAGNLKRTHKSCGCLNKETTTERNRKNIKHGLYKTREYRRATNAKRKEIKRCVDSMWTPLMEICLRNMFPACVVCGSDQRLCTDHVRPLIKGNGLIPGNAVILCASCNSSKKERDLESLPELWRIKIVEAAETFRLAWSGGF